jgi:hypothetical protein
VLPASRNKPLPLGTTSAKNLLRTVPDMELEEQDPLWAFAELLLQLKYGDQDVRVQNSLLLEVGLLLNSNPWLNAHHLALENRDITAHALAHVSSIKVSEMS